MSSFLVISSFFVGSYVGRVSSTNSDSYREQIKKAIYLSEEKVLDAPYLPLEFRYPYIYDPTEESFTIKRDTLIIDSPIEKLSLDSFLYLDSVNKEIKHRKLSFNKFRKKIHFSNGYKSVDYDF